LREGVGCSPKGTSAPYSTAHQPLDKRLDIFIVRKLEARAGKLEGCFRGERQNGLFIQEISDGHRGQKGAKWKRDTEPLGPLGLGDRSRFGQWSLHRDFDPSILSQKEQMPTVRGRANRSIIAACSTTPDRF